MANITDLPTEVLLKIFKFYMQTVSQIHFLNNISRVCVAWKNICLDSSLWTKYDGTPSFGKMIYLSNKGSLKNTKELILSSIDSLNKSTKKTEQEETEQGETNGSVRKSKKLKVSSSGSLKCVVNEAKLFQNVRNVEVISFSKVKKISNETLSLVAQNCTKLRDIKVGKKEEKIQSSLNNKMLADFFSIRGLGIKKIEFSFCKMPCLPSSIRCIANCCPNLEYLHLMNIVCNSKSFPTGYVQENCPKLKSLYLDENIIIENSKHPSGFSNLEEFVYSDQEGFYIHDKQFEYVVFNSPKLKFLCLTNCDISASIMLSLPATSVEYLSISRSKACSDESLSDLLKKWSHSLKEVDLSYGNCYVQHAVLKLIKTPVESPLEFLNLNFTPINLDLVENIIKYCSHLETLKLEGCRNVLRGMKRTYSNKLEFQELKEKISSSKSTNRSEVFTISDS